MRWLLIALVAMLAFGTPAAGQAPEPGRNQIVTVGVGRVEVTPNQATLTVGGQMQHQNAADAMTQVGRIATQVIARWQQLGIRQEDIRTSTVQVFPVYSQPRDGTTPQVTGYRATYTLTAAITNLALLGRALDGAVAGGANIVQGITFGLRDPAKARTDALGAAVRDAREKADAIAQAAGLRIRSIDRITEGGVDVQVREYRMAQGAAATPVEPGSVAVVANVTIAFNY
jgi:uncharacterized protein YggE